MVKKAHCMLEYLMKLMLWLPNAQSRLDILSIHTKKMRENSKLATDVNFKYLSNLMIDFSGAQIEQVIRLAASQAMLSDIK
ncbi:unnamed protein product, partial [Didymodactylos carnosus]